MNLIKLLARHYEQAEVTVEIKVTNLWTGKVECMEAKGGFIRHIEDPEMIIFFN